MADDLTLLITVVAASPGDDTPDVVAHTHGLEQELSAQPELQGRVRLQLAAPEQDTMGALAEIAVALVASAKVLEVFANTVAAWYEHQQSDVNAKIRRGDGSVFDLSVRLRRRDVLGLVDDLLRFASGEPVTDEPCADDTPPDDDGRAPEPSPDR
jgi:hypothetical protein